MELTLHRILEASGGHYTGALQPNQIFSGVSIDSRSVRRGEIFIALGGENFDGHDFVAKAIRGGAAAAIVEAGEKAEAIRSRSPKISDRLVLVPSTLGALHKLAKFAASSHKGVRVAITGSTGKTTVKDMLASILAKKGTVVANLKSFNNEIGLPLTLLGAPSDAEFIVLEMGMRARGDISLLAAIAQPSIGVVTNVGRGHIGRLGSHDAIAGAKSELIAAIPPTGTAIINFDNDLCRIMAAEAKARVLPFGAAENDGVIARILRQSGDPLNPRMSVEISYGKNSAIVELAVLGRHQAQNAAAAAAAAIACGCRFSDIVKGLEDAQLSPMRMEIAETSWGGVVINDAYNANPDSMGGALHVLASLQAGRRIAVLGSMKELGEYSSEAHATIGHLVADLPIDMLVTVGEEAADIAVTAKEAGLAEDVHAFDNVHDAIALLNSSVLRGDLILVKASRAMQLERISAALLGDSSEVNVGE